MFGDLESWIFEKGQTEICSVWNVFSSYKVGKFYVKPPWKLSYFSGFIFHIFFLGGGERKEEDRITVNKDNSSLLEKLNINSILFDLTQTALQESRVSSVSYPS